MPSLPAEEEAPPSWPTRANASLRAAIGADRITPVRTIFCFVMLAVGLSSAPLPWIVFGMVGAIGLALEWSRARPRP